MTVKDDAELLREYAANGSEEAFTTLVSRHVGMVYSVAIRQTANPHQAEEITQAVFIILARKAGSLVRVKILSGWLFHTTRLTASNYLRSEIRRRNREQEAFMQSNDDKNSNEEMWNQLAPLLDGAIGDLGRKDRDAIVLSYLQGKSCADVGRALGSTESAAQRRISRALDRLRKLFSKRGVVITGSMLASLMAANCAQAAPAGIATSVAAAGLLKGASASAATLGVIKGTLKVMAWAKLKLAAGIGAGVAVATGGTIFAVGFAAEPPHDKTELVGAPLSSNSPFVKFLSETPWIKKMQFVHGNFGVASFTNPNMVWVTFTNSMAVQPTGSYYSGNPHMIFGVNDQVYWTANDRLRMLRVTPLDPASRHLAVLEGFRPRIEEAQYLGLPALRPQSLAMHDDGTFTATTQKDDLLEGRILKASNDRPLALTYHFISEGTPTGTEEYNISVIYQYASETAPLPSIIGRMERSQVRQQTVFSGPNRSTTINGDRDGLSVSTNYILSVDYGLDDSITNGYSPTMFFPDVNEYRFQSNWWADGSNQGVTIPPFTPEEILQRAPTNRVNK